jgi:hypothetical protein
MRVPFTIILIGFLGCSSPKGDTNQRDAGLERIDTVFLDFVLGSSRKEYTSHIQLLHKKGTLVRSGSGSYFDATLDEIAGDLSKARIYVLEPEFDSDKLYSLSLKVEPAGNESLDMLKAYLKLSIVKKYSSMQSFQDNDEKQLFGNRPDYIAQAGRNLKIYLVESLDCILLTYSDFNVIDSLNGEKAKKSKLDAKETRDAL